ncbi:MAG: cytidylyltransferase domain-containing protein, partial [Candidatus Thorarchaeota archaeon]
GKALIDIAGQPMLERLCERLKLCRLAALIIVATSENSLAIVDFCQTANIVFTVGPEDDLLARHLLTAKEHDLSALVRVTADNPLTDPEGIDQLISLYQETRYPVIHNKHKSGYPFGTGAELVERSVLEKCNEEMVNPETRASIFSLLTKPGGIFNGVRVNAPPSLVRREYFLTVDYVEDLQLICQIYEAFQRRNDMLLKDIIAFLDQNPELANHNRHLHSGFRN